MDEEKFSAHQKADAQVSPNGTEPLAIIPKNPSADWKPMAQGHGGFQSVVEFAPVGIIECDTRGQCLYANAKGCEYLGLSNSEILGEGWIKALHPEDKEWVIAQWYAAAGQGMVFDQEVRFLHGNGMIFWIKMKSDFTRNLQGENIGMIGTLYNITEIKTRERRFQNHLSREKIAGELRASFLSPQDEIAFSIALKLIQNYFDSPLGFIGYIRQGDQVWVCPTLKTDASKTGNAQNTGAEFALEGLGDLWTEVLRARKSKIKNDPHQIPICPTALNRSMGAPIVLDGELLGSLQLANRVADYTPNDLRDLEEFCEILGPVLKVRLEMKRLEAERRHQEAILKQAKVEAERSTQRLEALVASLPDTYIRLDRQLTVTDYRANHEGLPLQKSESLLGKSLNAFGWGETVAQTLVDAANLVLKNGQTFTLEKTITLFEQQLSCEFRVVLCSNDEIIIYIRDITARHKLEEEMRRNLLEMERLNWELSDQKFALDQHSIVAITDLAGKITYANNRFCEISGYAVSELLGSNHRILNSGFHSQEFFLNMYSTLKKGEVWRGEICNRKKGGDLYWVDTTIVPFKEVTGKPYQYVAIRTDITARKEAEMELTARNMELVSARDQAVAAVKAKGDFLATMSHEIRTPMNGILGMIGLLLDTPLESTQKDFAQTVQSSAEGLLTIINDILDFSKIEAGKMDIEPIPFSVESALQEVVDLMMTKAYIRGLPLNLHIANDVPKRVIGDPGRIRQVLLNFVGNSLKFTEKGSINIEVKSSGKRADGKYLLRFEVADTGIGLTQEQSQKIFHAFIQADPSTTRKFGGTGLGLAISKRIIDLMEGHISVESQFGKGSTFWFEIPMAEDLSSTGTLASFELQGKRILIVDNQKTDLRITREQLLQAGCEIVEATESAQALQILSLQPKSTPFDLAILDWRMPLMDGEELARHIRSKPEFKCLPLLLVTASAAKGDARQMLAAGFQGFLVKPITAAVLHKMCSSLIDAYRQDPDAILTRKLPLMTRHSLQEKRVTALATDAIPQLGLRVLLAEDNVVNQKVAVLFLNKFGCRVDVAGNGKEALEMVELFPYDLILMDCQMPELDGYEATQQWRERERTRKLNHIPIIALTANALQTDRELCLKSGMDDYIAKPFKRETLLGMLQKWGKKADPTLSPPIL